MLDSGFRLDEDKIVPVFSLFKSLLNTSAQRIVLTAGLTILTAGLLLSLLRWQAYQRVEIEEVEKLSYQMKLVEKEVSGLVRSINIVLEEISNALASDDLDTAIKIAEHYKKIFPEIRSFTMVDHHGIIREASIKALIGGDRSQSAYFLEAKNNPDQRMMFLGRPFKDPLGASIMLYDRAVADGKGELKWLAIASVDLEFYDQALASIINTTTQTVLLSHGDGLVLSHNQDYEGLRLKSVSEVSEFATTHLSEDERYRVYADVADASGDSVFTVTADVIPQTILTSNRLIATISEDAATVFFTWKSDTVVYFLIWLLVSFLILFLVYLHTVRERSLMHSESRFIDFTETASDWIWETDDKLRFTYISERFFQLANLKSEDLLGKTRWEYTTSERAGVSKDAWQEHRSLMERHEAFRDFRYSVMDTDKGRHHISLNGKPVFIDGVFCGYRGTGSNITPLIEAINEARLAQKTAEAASLAKSQFLSSMSHELRTPMNAILGYSQLLELEIDDPELKENIGIILDSGRHLLTLIDDVLDLSRIETQNLLYELTPVDSLEMIEGCRILCFTQAEERGSRIIIDRDSIDIEASCIYADKVRLKQSLLNYISNAIKYGKPNGGTIHISLNRNNTMLRISVSDDGPGIPEDKISSLFMPFNRLGLEGGAVFGAGLGLSITKKLVEGMGGQVGVDSELGKGSVFWLELPTCIQDN